MCFCVTGLTCTEQNFITKAGSQRAASEHGIIIVAPDTSPRAWKGDSHTRTHTHTYIHIRPHFKLDMNGFIRKLFVAAVTQEFFYSWKFCNFIKTFKSSTCAPEYVQHLSIRRLTNLNLDLLTSKQIICMDFYNRDFNIKIKLLMFINFYRI